MKEPALLSIARTRTWWTKAARESAMAEREKREEKSEERLLRTDAVDPLLQL